MIYKPGKMAVMGDKDSTLAFKAIGTDTFIVQDIPEADTLLKQLAKEQYSVIFITEPLAAGLTNTLNILKIRPYPSVVPIPSSSGEGSGFAITNLQKDIEKAVGASVKL